MKNNKPFLREWTRQDYEANMKCKNRILLLRLDHNQNNQEKTMEKNATKQMEQSYFKFKQKIKEKRATNTAQNNEMNEMNERLDTSEHKPKPVRVSAKEASTYLYSLRLRSSFFIHFTSRSSTFVIALRFVFKLIK